MTALPLALHLLRNGIPPSLLLDLADPEGMRLALASELAASDVQRAPAPAVPCVIWSRAVLRTLARSKSTPSACGVLKSSSMAASNRARWAATSGQPALVGLRTGRHDCFDRLVVDLTGSGSGYRLRYVSAVRDQGRGAVVPLRGGGFRERVVHATANRRPVLPSVAG